MENKYNGEGLRVGKVVTQNNTATTSRYLYEYDKVVLEVNQSNVQTGFNVYGINLIPDRLETMLCLPSIKHPPHEISYFLVILLKLRSSKNCMNLDKSIY